MRTPSKNNHYSKSNGDIIIMSEFATIVWFHLLELSCVLQKIICFLRLVDGCVIFVFSGTCVLISVEY